MGFYFGIFYGNFPENMIESTLCIVTYSMVYYIKTFVDMHDGLQSRSLYNAGPHGIHEYIVFLKTTEKLNKNT
jgi:hypothetical protein